jgi:hypothetical protein
VIFSIVPLSVAVTRTVGVSPVHAARKAARPAPLPSRARRVILVIGFDLVFRFESAVGVDLVSGVESASGVDLVSGVEASGVESAAGVEWATPASFRSRRALIRPP